MAHAFLAIGDGHVLSKIFCSSWVLVCNILDAVVSDGWVCTLATHKTNGW